MSGLKLESDGKAVRFTQTMNDIFTIIKKFDYYRLIALKDYTWKLIEDTEQFKEFKNKQKSLENG